MSALSVHLAFAVHLAVAVRPATAVLSWTVAASEVFWAVVFQVLLFVVVVVVGSSVICSALEYGVSSYSFFLLLLVV